MFPTPEASLELIKNLSESYGVEVKSWFDIDKPEGKEKIVKALLALRNNDGGRLVIGFANDTMQPVEIGRPQSVRTRFVQDDIQAIVSKFSSEKFEILVQYIEFQGAEFPIICVPSGVRTPVVTRSELKDPDNGKLLVPLNAVYVRTLNTNNTVSTALIPSQDWDRLMEICFDNREADIGRFVRRHLSESSMSNLVSLLNRESTVKENSGTLGGNWLIQGRKAFVQALARKEPRPLNKGYFEVGAIIQGDLIEGLVSDVNMLNLIESANRNFKGWPLFIVLGHSLQKEKRPKVVGDAWETSLIFPEGDHLADKHIDFWRIQPDGHLYAIRAYREDFDEDLKDRKLAILFAIRDVTEGIAEALAIAKKMVQRPQNAAIIFRFRWADLSGRTLSTKYSNWPRASISGEAMDDEAESHVTLPVDLPDSVIADHVCSVLAPLFRKFQGFEVPQNFIHAEVKLILNGQ